jgi:hypothetical protein
VAIYSHLLFGLPSLFRTATVESHTPEIYIRTYPYFELLNSGWFQGGRYVKSWVKGRYGLGRVNFNGRSLEQRR